MSEYKPLTLPENWGKMSIVEKWEYLEGIKERINREVRGYL